MDEKTKVLLKGVDKAAQQTPLQTALQTLLDAVKPGGTEKIDLGDGLDRVLSEDVTATIDIPDADVSSRDGYAVYSDDVADASESNPAILKMVGKVPIGAKFGKKLKRGEAVQVATGSYKPLGADAVVMVEYTEPVRNTVKVKRAISREKNIVGKGTDVRKGKVVLQKGEVLRPHKIALLARLGISKISVHRKPLIGVLSTGDELQDIGRKLEAGKIVDTNRPSVISMVKDAGGLPIDFGIAKDNIESVRKALQKALKRCDAVLVSAGSSVGEKDLVVRVLDGLGRPGLLFHGIAMRPASPTGIAILNGKPLILLPGFPTSALVSCFVFGRPMISRMSGASKNLQPVVRARLASKWEARAGTTRLMRVKLMKNDGGLTAIPIEPSDASFISSTYPADGIIEVAEAIGELPAGELVDVLLL